MIILLDISDEISACKPSVCVCVWERTWCGNNGPQIQIAPPLASFNLTLCHSSAVHFLFVLLVVFLFLTSIFPFCFARGALVSISPFQLFFLMVFTTIYWWLFKTIFLISSIQSKKTVQSPLSSHTYTWTYSAHGNVHISPFHCLSFSIDDTLPL